MRISNVCGKALIAFMAMSSLAFGWGRTGHQIINGSFGKFLPASLRFISDNSSYYIAHASDADSRKSSDPSESPKHYIDIDYYPEFGLGNLSHDYDSLCAEYGAATVVDNGTLPWAIRSTYNALVVSMESQDWENANRLIADLGHYIGDAFQPLHCTQNYDGAMTNNRGIHSRFESGLLDRYQGKIDIQSHAVSRLDTSVLEYAFRVVGESNSRVGTIMNADSYAKSIDSKYGSAYYEALWSKLDTLMNEQLGAASEALASLVYSAWLDAGSPLMTGVVSPSVPTGFIVSDVYPNPFNPVGNIDVVLPQNSGTRLVRVAVYSPLGRLVRSETRNLVPGRNVIPLDLSGSASGIYLVIVRPGEPSRSRTTFLKAVLLK